MQNRSLKPDETHWEGSMGQVDRALRLSTPPTRLTSTSTESSKLCDLIIQTEQLVKNNKSKADALLQEYKKNMGEPFSSQEDNIPQRAIPDLALPDMPQNEWNALSNAQHLRQNYTAYTVLSAHLKTVLGWQTGLNPQAGQLIEQLKSVQQDISALLSNLHSLLQLVKAGPPSPPKPRELTAPNSFEQKVVGYNVCWFYYKWLTRSLKDLGKLKK